MQNFKPCLNEHKGDQTVIWKAKHKWKMNHQLG